MKKVLVIVDVQYDFANSNGALYVPGGEEVIPAIAQYIKDNQEDLDHVLFTLDWHPLNHCSFKPQGGLWPVHCVQHTHGATLSEELLNLCNELGVAYRYCLKGQNPGREEYGAFENGVDSNFDNMELVCCGLAGDYCVLETFKNLCKHCKNVDLFMPGIRSIDGGAALDNYLKSTTR